jgi:hypothetical protein
MVELDHACWRHEVDAADNEALFRRSYAQIDASHIDAMDEFVAEHYVDHNPPPFPDLPGGREGPKLAFRIFWRRPRSLRDRGSDRERRQGGDLAHRVRSPRARSPRTAAGDGAEIRRPARAIHRISAGRIVEHGWDRDDLGLMQQLGVGPRPAVERGGRAV